MRLLRPVVRRWINRPQGDMDAPIDGQAVPAGPLLVRGWAVDSRGRAAPVVVVKNRTTIVGATLGRPRPDVAERFPQLDSAGRSGWSAELEIGPEERNADVSVYVLVGKSSWRLLKTASIRVVDTGEAANVELPDWLFGSLDGRFTGSRPGGTFLRGWCLDTRGPIQGLVVWLDGRIVGYGTLGLERNDVAAQFPFCSWADRAGWRVVLDAEAKLTESKVVVLVRGHQGEWTTLVRRNFSSLVPKSAVSQVNDGFVDFPPAGAEVQRSSITVRGWALVNGSMASRLELFLDGSPPFRARLGVPRSDVATIHNIPDAAISGFERIVDFSLVPEGTGSLTLRAVAYGLDGAAHNLPLTEFRLLSDEILAQSAPDTPSRPVVTSRTRPLQSPGEQIRLLAFTHDLGYGGGQLYLFDLLSGLSRVGSFCSTVVAPDDGPLRERLNELSISVHLTGRYPLNNMAQYENRIEELTAWAREGGFDAALINTMGAFPGALVAERLGLPYAWAIHESYTPNDYWAAAFPPSHVHPEIRRLALRSLRGASAVVFEAKDTMSQYLGSAEPAVTHHVPYGIELEPIDAFRSRFNRSEARRAFGIPEEAFVVLCLGTVEPRKGQIVLTRAFAEIAGAFPEAFLVFVGARDEIHTQTLRQAVYQLGLSARVLVEPVTPETYGWYGIADLFVCASDVESLPRSVLEAMAFGLPVLASDIFGLSEVITDRQNGFLMEPSDALALRDSLVRVIGTRKEELSKIGNCARDLVAADYQSRGYIDWFRRFFEGDSGSVFSTRIDN